MKTKIFAFVLITLVYVFPFRYAVLEPTSSNTINLLCMLATVFGTLIFMGLTMSDGKNGKISQFNVEGAQAENAKARDQAA